MRARGPSPWTLPLRERLRLYALPLAPAEREGSDILASLIGPTQLVRRGTFDGPDGGYIASAERYLPPFEQRGVAVVTVERVASTMIPLKAEPGHDDSEVIPTGTTSEYQDEGSLNESDDGKDGSRE